MNIILCASKFENLNILSNANKIIEMLKKPFDSKIEFILFGETFLNGFDSLTWNYVEDKDMEEETKKYVEIIGIKAKEWNRGVGFGYLEFDNGCVFSSYIVYDNNGTIICNYRRISEGWRIHKADRLIYKEGNVVGEFTYQNQHIGIALCGDVWEDELYNELINKEFDILFWPVYTDYHVDEWVKEVKEEYLSRSKLLASNVLYINSVSTDGSFGGTYFQSNGELICETALSNQESFLLVDIDVQK